MAHNHTYPKKAWQATRTEAIESLLNEIGVLSSDDVDRVVKHYEENVGPKTGASVIARAWVDPDFKKRLLADGLSACAELGIGGPETELLHVVENTPKVQNVVVCTLCSCYPWPILGLPPVWYKSSAYRSRLVREPRKVLSELGVELDDDVEVRVWDSVSEIRYLVMPERPQGTEHLSETELAALISRDHMIGVAREIKLTS
ncbi:nitrile hydratase subunit alpha [Marinobacter sp.]|jgi:nitrile hydratase subunit alpha|uniref:nitrile hydratase subunit alpha n=1 Tax=Marinobacter sp. TaxID=50741 RepID=UPI000C6A9FE0|nr:nitrile hydratase subunit alpha [Marinobacter sp.]MAK49215.1 nitrile hydratase subunit alpha [Marinobacter sp.]MAO28507.1 nitrile hydratase subunit alpha [Roseovarius sp.]MTI78697.1 nitrile hydratase subunit alpha [Marinobacter sp.]|tara:strand:+ start:2537 stop:3142 length:606 start_codon:yes stop_codon:yes gene_type:complete